MIVCCDIDGVLADVRDFYYLVPDWEEYYKHSLELPDIPELVMLVDSLVLAGHNVIFITGRPLSIKQDTVLWLMRHIPSLEFVEIRMRPDGDLRLSAEIKVEMLRELKPSLVIEDEPRATDAIRDEGFPVLQVHGYRHTREDSVPYGRLV